MAQAFRDIQRQRMAGLPFLNPLLQVEAVGFRLFQDSWLGVLITPWCMNYLMLPGHATAWRSLPEATRQRWQFPAGELDFVVAQEPSLGIYQQCPLFASMQAFDSQDMVREAAQAALATLFQAAASGQAETEISHSRRNFLCGQFNLGGKDGSGR